MNDRSGGPAFPCNWDDYPRGISLRAYIATKALQGLCANPVLAEGLADITMEERYRLTAVTAVHHADAMLAELEKP